jgi:Tol biopolymer transport system component
MIVGGPVYGASFAPDGSNRLAYGSAASQALSATVNIHIVRPNGSGHVRITGDGRSLNPVWGRSGIAFDHERIRTGAEPVYQVWLMRADGTHRVQETNMSVPPLHLGLVPLGFSGDGRWLLAEYEGQDTSQAWVINVASGRLTKLAIAGHAVTGAAISHHGADVLVDRGGYLNPPSNGVVESIPLRGGRPRTLIPHGSAPSWNL